MKNKCAFSSTLASDQVKRFLVSLKMSSHWLPVLLLACTRQLGAAQEALIFQASTAPTPTVASPPIPSASSSNWVLVNNVRVPGGLTPFVTAPPPTQQFLDCFGRCPTTPEYRPICGSNMQLYLNEQKFNCARFCGAGKFWEDQRLAFSWSLLIPNISRYSNSSTRQLRRTLSNDAWLTIDPTFRPTRIPIQLLIFPYFGLVSALISWGHRCDNWHKCRINILSAWCL